MIQLLTPTPLPPFVRRLLLLFRVDGVLSSFEKENIIFSARRLNFSFFNRSECHYKGVSNVSKSGELISPQTFIADYADALKPFSVIGKRRYCLRMRNGCGRNANEATMRQACDCYYVLGSCSP